MYDIVDTRQLVFFFHPKLQFDSYLFFYFSLFPIAVVVRLRLLTDVIDPPTVP